jgi:hypothetical protein
MANGIGLTANTRPALSFQQACMFLSLTATLKSFEILLKITNPLPIPKMNTQIFTWSFLGSSHFQNPLMNSPKGTKLQDKDYQRADLSLPYVCVYLDKRYKISFTLPSSLLSLSLQHMYGQTLTVH